MCPFMKTKSVLSSRVLSDKGFYLTEMKTTSYPASHDISLVLLWDILRVFRYQSFFPMSNLVEVGQAQNLKISNKAKQLSALSCI